MIYYICIMNSKNIVPIVAKRTTRDALKALKFDLRVESIDEVLKVLIDEHKQREVL